MDGNSQGGSNSDFHLVLSCCFGVLCGRVVESSIDRMCYGRQNSEMKM